jgi:hypothetical protein
MRRSLLLLLALAGCHSGPGMVEQAMFVPTLHGDVLVTVQRGATLADEHLSAYSVQTGETLGTAHLGERTDLRCAPASTEHVWCVSHEEPVSLYVVPAVVNAGATLDMKRKNPMLPPLDAQAPSWVDPSTRALVVQTDGGGRWALDASTLAASRYAGDAATMARIGEQPEDCQAGTLVHLGAANLELRGEPRAALFRDASPLHPEQTFYEGRFLMGDDCHAVELDGPPSVVVADEGTSGGGGEFVRVGVDGAVVWRSPRFESPYSVLPGKRERERVIVVMPHEIAALGVGDGQVLWKRTF